VEPIGADWGKIQKNTDKAGGITGLEGGLKITPGMSMFGSEEGTIEKSAREEGEPGPCVLEKDWGRYNQFKARLTQFKKRARRLRATMNRLSSRNAPHGPSKSDQRTIRQYSGQYNELLGSMQIEEQNMSILLKRCRDHKRREGDLARTLKKGRSRNEPGSLEKYGDDWEINRLDKEMIEPTVRKP
jgi:hypothetical protein